MSVGRAGDKGCRVGRSAAGTGRRAGLRGLQGGHYWPLGRGVVGGQGMVAAGWGGVWRALVGVAGIAGRAGLRRLQGGH